MGTEDQLIARIGKSLPSITRWRKVSRTSGDLPVLLGIGDDAAIIHPRDRTDLILTCDSSIEGIHFLREVHPADSVGYKALARAASDIAAMGAIPRAFLLTLALPKDCAGKWLAEFLAGMRRAARLLNAKLIGGDTTQASRIFISIVVLGTVPHGRALTRSGARPGDLIYVSGRLGEAELGLELIRSKLWKQRTRRNELRLRPFLQKHLYPEIRIALGAWLAQKRIASAMMDLSDGLSIDLARLCRASKVGARIDSQKVPCVEIPEAVRRAMRGNRLDSAHLALHGGEDYELLFTVPKRRATMLRGAPGFAELSLIGEITRERKIVLMERDGRARPLKPGGWDPFRQ